MCFDMAKTTDAEVVDGSERSFIECAICFNEMDHGADLPCACLVEYCVTCWDRALAQSFQDSGQAKCPTCRMSIHVDYDAEKLQLIFGKADRQEVPHQRSAQHLFQHQHRLAAQAMPAQIRFLQEFGEQLPVDIRETSLCVSSGSSDAVSSLGARCAEAASTGPSCVCGVMLERVSGLERARRWCTMNAPHVAVDSITFNHIVEEMLSQSASYCDLCDEHLPPGGAVWTCQNGNRTILHANAFDVCDLCLVRNACTGVSVECTNVQPQCDSAEADLDADTCRTEEASFQMMASAWTSGMAPTA